MYLFYIHNESTLAIMTASMIRNQLIGVGVLMMLPVLVWSQDDLLASHSDEISPHLQLNNSKVEEALIIDKEASGSSYPSMEEEMKIYMELKTKTPKAFFFPNPSKGVVWIEHNLGRETNLFIEDLDGNVVFQAQRLQVKKLDLTTFKSGKYLLRLTSGSKEVSKQLIVR